ncbi:LCP family protein [Adlercreutzia sp. ZJ138]|uniref:LCP family protein n=1 Tax=Adlercreutzia sp. ZJ138 TaxID=2709405 RepID=UPI001F152475|nr:LCP family protein [Adlercreutzia sp. ZJ138]
MARRKKNTQQYGQYNYSYEQQARQRMANGNRAPYPGASYGSVNPAGNMSQYSRMNPAYSKKSSRMGVGKKIAIGVLVAFIVAALGVGSAAALYFNSVNNELTKGDKTDDELLAIQDALSTDKPKSFTEPFYMMLIGSDKREDGSVGGSRSDTNMVVRVDPAKSIVTMVSIPRDTQIQLEGYGTNKFNAAYNYLGAAGAIEEAEKLLDIDISHYAEVDFESLSELVDAVGGVDITVEEPIDDPHIPGVYIEAGEQHLNGEQALAYARSRQFADGDFTRTAHQRELVMAIVNEVLAMPVTDLPRVISAAASCVTTDLSVDDLIDLATQFKDSADELVIYSAMVPSYTGMEDGISYVYTDEAVLDEFMRLVEAGEDPSTVEAVSTGGSDTSDSSGTDQSGAYYDDSSAYYTDPGYNYGYTDPNYVDPGVVDPNFTNPGYVDPGYSDPGYVDPGYTQGQSAAGAGGVATGDATVG